MKKATIFCAGLLAASLLAGCAQPSVSSTPAATVQTTTSDSSFTMDLNKRYEYEVREMTVDNHGETIWGEAYIPKTGGKLPLVLTSHGMGANHESGTSYAKKYAPRGFAVYTWDFRGGSNANNENRSDGKSTDISVMTEVSDVEAILDAVKSWDFVDTDHIYLQGGSQGGLVTAITGLRRQDEVAGLILLYPAFGMVALGAQYSEDMPEENQVGSIIVGKRFFKDMEEADVRDELQNFTKPVLILQGSEDGLVSPESSEAAAQSYPDAEYHLIEGAGHGFSGEHHDQATNYALDFLAKHY